MNKRFTRLLRPLLCALSLGTAYQAKAGFVPVTVTGFTADIVANGAGTVQSSTTSDMDGGAVNSRFAFVAPTYVSPNGAVPTSYLPANGLVNSVATSGLSFQLPSYSGNNSLRISGVGTGTLTLATPQSAGEVYFLASSGNGISTATVTVTFTDGTTQVFAGQTVANWFGGTGFALQGVSRVNYDNDVIENSTTDPRLYQGRLVLTAANYTKSIQSVAFSKTSTTATLNVMAISLSSLCTGTPTGGTAVASATSVCASAGVNLSLTGSTNDAGITYQWQSSTDNGVTWNNIAGATAATYTATGQSVTTQYRARLTCTSSSLSANSSAVTVTASAPTYATLPVAQSFESTWIDVCSTRDAPNASWRNTPATGNNSWRREDDGTAAGWTSPTSYLYNPVSSQGSHSARFHSGYSTGGLLGSLDMFVNLSAVGAKRLSFDYVNISGTDSLVVLLSNDGGATFSRLAGYALSATFTTQVLPISSTSATAVIRFRARADFGSTDIGLDNVILESATGCLTPATLAAGAITATTASVSWLASGTGTYTVLYGPTGFNPAQPSSSTNVYTTAANITAPPYTITGLTPSTTYQFYVIQNCSATTTSGTAGPVAFTTACVTPTYATLPITESFENTWISRCDVREVPNNNWRNTPLTGNNSWRREDDPTAANWTLPTSYLYSPASSQGQHSARFHSGYSTAGLIGTMDLFVNLSATGAKRLSFDFVNISGTDSLTVQISNDGGATFSRLGGYALSATFTTQVLPISSTSATAVIRFRARADYGSTDIGLDNIILESATGCLTPASLTATTTTTTASLSWLTGGTGTYTVVYGPTGFNPSQPTSTTNVYTTATGITAPPYAITGLTPGTTYQFYVTLNCGAGANSGTAGPQSFTTQIVNDDPCGATALTINNTCTPLATTTVGATQTATTVYATGGQGAGCGSITAPRDVWFSFTTAATGPTSTAVRISVTGGAASVIRAYSGTACTGPLTYINCAGTAANTAAPNLDLTNLTPSTTYYVRVNEYSTLGTLGNFTICATPVPNCPTPAGLGASAITNTTAVINWSVAPATGSTFTVQYGLSGFTPGGAGSTAITGITGQTTTLTNLTPNSNYCFVVQQVCGGFNGSSTISAQFCFNTLLTAPANDEPCAATPLGTAVLTSTTVGATTTVRNSILLPACSSAQSPKDVWFTMTPTGTTATLTVTGTAAGVVRLYTTADCSTDAFTFVTCQGAPGGSNAGFTSPVVLTGLTAGQRYYVAVNGFGSSDTPGTFTIGAAGVATATTAKADTDALLVYPNPSNTGQLTLRLSGLGRAGQATLLNALGQVVRTQPLTGAAEQTLSTRGLATGLYTLRVTGAGEVLTRKVVLE